MTRDKKILILGVTASGKGKLAFELAKELGGEIISADSMKVYKGMDIGTAKPPLKVREQIPWYLIDVAEPWEAFSVAKFLELANQRIEQIRSADKPVIVVGGTALYIKSLLYGLFKGPGSDEQIRGQLKQKMQNESSQALHEELASLDPETAQRVHPNDAKRIIRGLEVYKLTGKPISSFKQQWDESKIVDWKIIGLHREKSVENHRINMRVKKMMDEGLVDEVKTLLSKPKPLSKQAKAAIGYSEIIDYLENKMDLEKTVERIKINTRRLAKHQRTWFKRFTSVNWLDIDENQTKNEILQKTLELMNNKKS
jgi:tRNA dimethylallyltransferase